MLKRKKTELSVKFRLRTGQTTGPIKRQLQIRLTVLGETVSDYSSGVTILPERWDAPTQLAKGRSKEAAEVNEQLSEIEQQHREIWRELKRKYSRGDGPLPTSALLRKEWLTPGASDPRLLDFFSQYEAYLLSLENINERAIKTRKRAELAGNYIEKFLSGENQSGLTLSGVTTAHGKRFHAWLQLAPDGTRRMNRDSANKYLQHFRDALEYAIESGYLATNALTRFRPKRGKGKEVYFLEPEHIERLLGLRFTDQLNIALWWTKLMCFTGLDYVDAVRYAKDRNAFQRRNGAGLKIVIDRCKLPNNTCQIPLIGQVGEQVDSLFDEYPTGPYALEMSGLNKYLKLIQIAVCFDKPLTSKICRKTAGALFLREGYQMSTVSKALGHSSIRTTETHYVKVTASATDYDMDRVARMQAQGAIKLRPATSPQPFGQFVVAG